MFQVSYCNNHNIHVTAYTSLGNTAPNRLLNNAVIHKIGKRYNQMFRCSNKKIKTRSSYSYGRSSAQILLRWSLQQGCSVVPKSLNAKHITENKQLDFKMEQADIDKIFVLFQ